MPSVVRVAHPGWLVLLAACGRLGFDPPSADPGDPIDGNPGTGTPQSIACADKNLSSRIGSAVASGSTGGDGSAVVPHNRFQSCGGDGNDMSFGWTAPAAGRYVIDTCASDTYWDSVVSVRDGGCAGTQLACSDDVCGTFNSHARVTVTLAAGQAIVIVVDSAFAGLDGSYQLAITPQ